MSEATEHRAQELQRLWKSLVKLFPTWSLPLDWFFSPTSWRMLGVDLMTSIAQNPRSRRVAARLDGVSEETVATLSQMAKLNAVRATDLFRAVAVCYITLPIALAAFLSDAAPEMTRAYLAENFETIARLVVALVVTPIIYFLGMWRAKQLAWAIDLHRAGGLVPLRPKTR
jgi:hypothetical protein